MLDFAKKLVPHPLDRNRRIPIPRRVLVISNHHIPSVKTAKFLGIILDNKLSWNVQGMAALAKGQDWLAKFRRMAGTNC